MIIMIVATMLDRLRIIEKRRDEKNGCFNNNNKIIIIIIITINNSTAGTHTHTHSGPRQMEPSRVERGAFRRA